MTDDREVLSALLDREEVDADVLARVLESPEHRRLLVDFVRLRTTLQADADATRATDSGTHGAATRPVLPPAVWRTAAALALVSAGLAGGWYAGRTGASDAPPEPSRVVQLAPVTDASGGQP